MRGRLIVIEGGDGAGTTTQSDALCKRLGMELEREGKGRRVMKTREPYQSEYGKYLRGRLREMEEGGSKREYEELALGFAALRLQHLREYVEPNLERGHVVVSDRYTLSSMVYQGLHCERDWLVEINRGARVADLLVYLRCTEEVCRQRVKSRGEPLDVYERGGMMGRVLEGYEREYERYAVRGRSVVVDGDLPPYQVLEGYWGAVLKELC